MDVVGYSLVNAQTSLYMPGLFVSDTVLSFLLSSRILTSPSLSSLTLFPSFPFPLSCLLQSSLRERGESLTPFWHHKVHEKRDSLIMGEIDQRDLVKGHELKKRLDLLWPTLHTSVLPSPSWSLNPFHFVKSSVLSSAPPASQRSHFIYFLLYSPASTNRVHTATAGYY